MNIGRMCMKTGLGGGRKASYFYGYDAEMQQAWRAHPAAAEKKEWTANFRIGSKKPNDLDPMIAVFTDGDEHPIVEFTHAEWKVKSEIARSTRKGALWESTHNTTKAALKISYRSDRKPILILQEDGKQVLQVLLDNFKGHDDTPNDPDSMQARALGFLSGIAQEYADGKLSKDMLKNERDARMTKHMAEGGTGTRITKKPSMKRPAGRQAKTEPEPDDGSSQTPETPKKKMKGKVHVNDDRALSPVYNTYDGKFETSPQTSLSFTRSAATIKAPTIMVWTVRV